MSKFGPILKDGIVLFAVSTGFVYVTNLAFSSLERNKPADDPIVTAIMQNDSRAVEKLAGEGPNATSQTDEFGRTALMRAAYASYSSAERTAETDKARAAMVAVLLQNGAVVNTRDRDGWTALAWASWSGLPAVAETLLKAGAQPNIADKRGNTPLIIAAQMGHAGMVVLLLAHGAAITASNQSHAMALNAAEIGMKQYPAKKASYEAIIAALRSARI